MIEVTYIDHMGSDLSVVNAARVSFGKKSEWHQRIYTGEPNILKTKDAKLINYLAKHNHKSPFNHTFATFHVKAPIFVARQLVKHEYMPWNEISRRYVMKNQSSTCLTFGVDAVKTRSKAVMVLLQHLNGQSQTVIMTNTTPMISSTCNLGCIIKIRLKIFLRAYINRPKRYTTFLYKVTYALNKHVWYCHSQ